MTKIAIIGGTGLTTLSDLKIIEERMSGSPYGNPSDALTFGELNGHDIIFLPRHGKGHTIAPHKVNYRANLHALRELEVETIIAVNAVGGITQDMAPETVVIPDQIIDYTYSREHTFFNEHHNDVMHIDFTQPYCESLRQSIIQSARKIKIELIDQATYAATQGPRLESTAEINRLERDGCHIVGMTGMPEASLARELNIGYASISVVANRAAGRGEGEITMSDIEHNLKKGIDKVKQILSAFINDHSPK